MNANQIIIIFFFLLFLWTYANVPSNNFFVPSGIALRSRFLWQIFVKSCAIARTTNNIIIISRTNWAPVISKPNNVESAVADGNGWGSEVEGLSCWLINGNKLAPKFKFSIP